MSCSIILLFKLYLGTDIWLPFSIAYCVFIVTEDVHFLLSVVLQCVNCMLVLMCVRNCGKSVTVLNIPINV